MQTFDESLAAFVKWRAKVGAICGQPVPSEISELLAEQAQLEPMRWEAEEWRAKAVAAYYSKKAQTIAGLWVEVAKTALHDIAKAQAHRELGFRELAHGTAGAIFSCILTVKAELKRLGVAP